MAPQLVMIITPHGRYYGELLDKHIFRGSERKLNSDDFTKKPLSDEWRLYLNNLIVEVDTLNGWKKTFVEFARSCLVSSTGYIIPRIVLKDYDFVKAFPKFIEQPPVTGIPPPVVVKTAPVERKFTIPRPRSSSTSSVEAVNLGSFCEYGPKHKSVRFA
jgi:hypothetical protein